jgi:hypothetical protein
VFTDGFGYSKEKNEDENGKTNERRKGLLVTSQQILFG